MTPLQRIFVVVEARDPGFLSTGARNPSQREFDQYDRFVDELRQETGARVELLDCSVKDAPRNGLVLVAYHPADRSMLMERRDVATSGAPPLILLNIRQTEATALAETLRPAGMVISDRFRRWVHRQDDAILTQVFGPKSLAPALAPLFAPDLPGETENYCTYATTDAHPLPMMIARYADAYWGERMERGARG